MSLPAEIIRTRYDVPFSEQGAPVQEVRFHVGDDIKLVADHRPGRTKSRSLIVNLHGIICSKEMATGIFDDSQTREYTVINFDLVGYGKSSKPKGTFGYTMKEQAKVLAEALQQVEYDEIEIDAHSMAGPIGYYLAEKLLDLNNGKKITLNSLEGNTTATDCGIISRQLSDADNDTIRKTLKRIAENLETPNNKSDGEKKWAKEMRDVDPDIVRMSAASLVQESDDPAFLATFIQLRERGVIVRYVWGENSDQRRDSESYLKPIFEAKGIETIIIPGVGHFVQDNPVLWSQLRRPQLNTVVV